jgi:hypothetical protein
LIAPGVRGEVVVMDGFRVVTETEKARVVVLEAESVTRIVKL